MSSIVLWSITLVIAALGFVASVQSWRFGRFVAHDAERLFALHGAGSPIQHLEALPPPVRRYAELVGATTHAPVRAMRLRHAGTFRTALDRPPMPIRGEQYFSSDLPGFVWWGRVAMAPGLWVEARDACIGGEGNMLIRVESTYTLEDARGPALDEGALLRLLGEMAWFPTSLLDQRYVTWSPIDDRSARATLRLRGREVSASFFFGADGLLARMAAERPRSDGTRAPWVGEYSDYREVEGLRVPFVASVSWVLDGVRTEYAHWIVEAFDFDHAEPF